MACLVKMLKKKARFESLLTKPYAIVESFAAQEYFFRKCAGADLV